MTDSISPQHRSWIMGRVRSRNTKPEIVVRSLLHRLGYRFTVRGPLNRTLPGHPDIVLPKYRSAVFVHGCFWHRHRNCPSATLPQTRTDYWQKKFDANTARDRRQWTALKKRGWRVAVVWECKVARDPQKVAQRLDRWLRPRKAEKVHWRLPDRKTLWKMAEARADYRVLSASRPAKPKPPTTETCNRSRVLS
jgi:DNA mismatch endonuclease, patch repair protein